MHADSAHSNRLRIPPAAIALALAGLALVLLFWRIGAYPLTDGDAGYYGRVARNILDSGEWIVLRYDPASAMPDADKPPLGIWMTAVVFRAFGPTDVVARAWHSIVALALLALTAALAARVFGRQAALPAAAALLTSGLFFYQAREPMLDVPLAALLTLAVWLTAGADPSRFWRRYYAACAVVGLGVMTKGPEAAALVAAPFAVALVATGRSQTAPNSRTVARALAGVAIAVGVILPWHLWAFSRGGAPFADMYLGTLSWRRYLKPEFLPGAALLPYAVLTLLAVLPWSGLAVPAFLAAWRERRLRPGAAMLCAYVAWTIVFFGLSPGSIIIRYILPILPASAALIGGLIIRPHQAAFRGGAIATVVIGAALLPAAIYVGRLDVGAPGAGPVLRTFLVLLAAAMIAGGAVLLRHRGPGVAVLAAGAAAAYLVVTVQALPIVVRLYPERDIAREVNEADGRGARVAVFKPSSFETMLAFYLDAPLERLASDADLARFLARPGRGWLIERPGVRLPDGARQLLVTVDDRGRAVLLRTKQ